MKQEKIILSFIAVLIGLLVSGAAFYFYQSAKVTSPNNANSAFAKPTMTQKQNQQKMFLDLDKPTDESISANKTIVVNGKTLPNATIAIITYSDQEIVKSNGKGEFSTTITLDTDENIIEVKAISQNGESLDVKRVVTYSTQNY
jgi:hypothetical protein